MSNKIRKWERDYNNYKDGKIDEIIKNMKDELSNHTKQSGTREDAHIQETKKLYKEIESMEKIKGNISKVENILELREMLQNQKNEIEQEVNRRNELKNISKENDELEQEMGKILKERDELKAKLKEKSLNDKDRKELSDKLTKNIENTVSNNEKFSINSTKLENAVNAKKSELSELDIAELDEKAIQLSTKISMCNIACNNLMKGYSWKSVEVKIDAYNNEKLTPKDKKVEKVVKSIKNSINKEKNDEVIENSAIIRIDIEKEENYNEENALTEVSEFDQKHPMLAKIKNWFKNRFGKEETTQEPEPKTNVEPKTEKVVEQPKNEEVQKVEVNQKDEFKKYLREVAEKGMSTIEQDRINTEAEEKAKRVEAAKAKLAANKAAASERDAAR